MPEAKDPFGNFVLQAIATFGAPRYRRRLVETICQDIEGFAYDRIASNVVRKVLRYSSLEDQVALIDVVTSDPQRLGRFRKHKTGSFVLHEVRNVKTTLALAGLPVGVQLTSSIMPTFS